MKAADITTTNVLLLSVNDANGDESDALYNELYTTFAMLISEANDLASLNEDSFKQLTKYADIVAEVLKGIIITNPTLLLIKCYKLQIFYNIQLFSLTI